MRKSPRTSLILDTLHKGVVCTCVGVTLIGTYLLGSRIYHHFAVIRPAMKQKELLAKQNLLAEGASDNLQDNAASIQL